MNIAIIGWGSLIWEPKSLRTRTGWYCDGPRLPLELARISKDGRLTLVIHPGSEEQTTYWALSEYTTLRQAIFNLRKREGSPKKRVGLLKAGDTNRCPIEKELSVWLKTKPGIDAVVWTDLRTNWLKKRGCLFTCEDALRYLAELERRGWEATECLNRTWEYLRNIPAQIQPQVRKILHQEGRDDHT